MNTDYQSLCVAPLSSVTPIGERSIFSSSTVDWERYGAPISEGLHTLEKSLSQVYLMCSASSCGTQSMDLGKWRRVEESQAGATLRKRELQD